MSANRRDMVGKMAGGAVDCSREAARTRRRLVRAEPRRRGGEEWSIPPPSVQPERSRRPRDNIRHAGGTLQRSGSPRLEDLCGGACPWPSTALRLNGWRGSGSRISTSLSLRPPRLCANKKLRASASPREPKPFAPSRRRGNRKPPPRPTRAIWPHHGYIAFPSEQRGRTFRRRTPGSGDGGPMPR